MENGSVQRDSKHSEYEGARKVKNINSHVQLVSKISEYEGARKVRPRLAGPATAGKKSGKMKNALFNDYPKCRSRVSKIGFVVAPSVSDGLTQTGSKMSRMFEKTEKRYAQRDSNGSESGVQMSLGCVQNGFCCSAVRLGRGFKSSFSERGRNTGTGVQNEGGGCPEWVLL